MAARNLRRFLLTVGLAASAALATPAWAEEPADKAEPALVQGTPAPEAAHEGHEAAHEGHEHHVPTLDDFNWFYGFIGEKDGVEPSLLWRPKGMPVPFGAMLLNSAILYYLLIRFAKKPIADALKSRKSSILRGMEEAGKMKSDAEASLAQYEEKLANIDQEIKRVRDEMHATGQAERARILAEAKDKRVRLERDAALLIEQELKAAREALMGETVRGALASAEATLRAKLTAADQSRLAEDYLSGMKSAAAALRGKV